MNQCLFLGCANLARMCGTSASQVHAGPSGEPSSSFAGFSVASCWEGSQDKEGRTPTPPEGTLQDIQHCQLAFWGADQVWGCSWQAAGSAPQYHQTSGLIPPCMTWSPCARMTSAKHGPQLHVECGCGQALNRPLGRASLQKS